MKDRKLLTDVELRAHWFRTREAVYTVAPGTYVTQTAWEFMKEQGIELRFAAPLNRSSGTMTVTPIPSVPGRAKYVDYATGKPFDRKPEEMTHLRGNQLVSKCHPRIAFRGQLDSLMARIMQVQIVACECDKECVAQELEELLRFVRCILGAEVKDEPLPEMNLLGMNSAQIREISHHVREHLGISHPIPSYTMGKLCVSLNQLRTQVREVELSAVNAFCREESETRPDIIEGLNRLSSCVYILFCRVAAGKYDEVK